MNPQTPQNPRSREMATAVSEFELLPPLPLNQSEFQPDGPIASLRLELGLPEEGATEACAQSLAELLHSLSDQEIAPGGQGLALDQAAFRLDVGKVSLLLRPLDVLGSFDRFHRLAESLDAVTVSELSNTQPTRMPNQANASAIEFFHRLHDCFLSQARRANRDSVPQNPWPRLSVQVVA